VPVRTFTTSELEMLRRVKVVIQTAEPGARVILYGSRARGDAEQDSDWDLLVLLDGPVDRRRMERVRDFTFDLELALDDCPVLSTIVYSQEQWNTPLYRATPFHESVTSEGVEL
jgi:uncharacterized protein